MGISSASLSEDCEEVGIRVALRPIAAKLFLALLSSSDPSASSGTSALGLSEAYSKPLTGRLD